jgi:hypothetical protein
MADFLIWVENLSFSTFVRESGSLWAFPMFLFMHTFGLSIVAGGSAMMDFAVLGLWPSKAPIKPLERLYPIIWIGFWLNAFTGVGLLAADASTKGTNPDFWVKMVCVAGGVTMLILMRKRVFRNPGLDTGPLPPGARTLAWLSLVCWFGAIVAGRLIAYVGPVAGVG